MGLWQAAAAARLQHMLTAMQYTQKQNDNLISETIFPSVRFNPAPPPRCLSACPSFRPTEKKDLQNDVKSQMSLKLMMGKTMK